MEKSENNSKVSIKLKTIQDRCLWVMDSKLYQDYPDFEWGIKVYDDEILFKFLILENFQLDFS
tara:strand:+ start:694 stop:882 length:189 start_codon:yes stop_codon:yes gene_type:complete